MTAENKDFFEALSMLEHERGITAEYLIEKIKAAIIIAVKKNYEVEEDHIRVDIDPDTGRFDVALIQDIVAGGCEPAAGTDPYHQLPAGGCSAGTAVRAQRLRSRCAGRAGELAG